MTTPTQSGPKTETWPYHIVNPGLGLYHADGPGIAIPIMRKYLSEAMKDARLYASIHAAATARTDAAVEGLGTALQLIRAYYGSKPYHIKVASEALAAYHAAKGESKPAAEPAKPLECDRCTGTGHDPKGLRDHVNDDEWPPCPRCGGSGSVVGATKPVPDPDIAIVDPASDEGMMSMMKVTPEIEKSLAYFKDTNNILKLTAENARLREALKDAEVMLRSVQSIVPNRSVFDAVLAQAQAALLNHGATT